MGDRRVFFATSRAGPLEPAAGTRTSTAPLRSNPRTRDTAQRAAAVADVPSWTLRPHLPPRPPPSPPAGKPAHANSHAAAGRAHTRRRAGRWLLCGAAAAATGPQVRFAAPPPACVPCARARAWPKPPPPPPASGQPGGWCAQRSPVGAARRCGSPAGGGCGRTRCCRPPPAARSSCSRPAPPASPRSAAARFEDGPPPPPPREAPPPLPPSACERTAVHVSPSLQLQVGIRNRDRSCKASPGRFLAEPPLVGLCDRLDRRHRRRHRRPGCPRPLPRRRPGGPGALSSCRRLHDNDGRRCAVSDPSQTVQMGSQCRWAAGATEGTVDQQGAGLIGEPAAGGAQQPPPARRLPPPPATPPPPPSLHHPPLLLPLRPQLGQAAAESVRPAALVAAAPPPPRPCPCPAPPTLVEAART